MNGALIENGNRKSQIRILTKDALVLRERLFLTPETTDSPLGRAALLAQDSVLGLIDRENALMRLRHDLPVLIAAAATSQLVTRLSDALNHIDNGRLRAAFMLLARTLHDSGGAPTEQPL